MATVYSCKTNNYLILILDNLTRDVKVYKLGHNRLRLRWRQIGDTLSPYTLSYRPTLHLTNFITINPTQYANGTYDEPVNNLQSCTHYTFLLRAYDSSYCGIPQVHVISVTTLPGSKN